MASVSIIPAAWKRHTTILGSIGSKTVNRIPDDVSRKRLVEKPMVFGKKMAELIANLPHSGGIKRGRQLRVSSLGTSLIGIKSEQEERIDTLVREIKDILSSLGDGEISPSAYDTAWIARIPALNDASKPHFPTTLEWIMKNQLEDGSWGDGRFFYLYDRLVCTLSCVLTLTLWQQGEELIANGIHFLQTRIQDLEMEICTGRTIGFEVVFPSMLNEARRLGINLPYELPCLKQINKLREEKMGR